MVTENSFVGSNEANSESAATEGGFVVLNKTNPTILLEPGGKTRARIWFWTQECEVDELALDRVCADLNQRSHDGIRVIVTDLSHGMLTIQRHPAIQSDISLDEAVKRLSECLRKAG